MKLWTMNDSLVHLSIISRAMIHVCQNEDDISMSDIDKGRFVNIVCVGY